MKYDEIAILVLLAFSLSIVNNIAGKRPSQTKTLSNLTSPRTPIITPIMTLFSLDLRRDLSLAKIAMQRTKVIQAFQNSQSCCTKQRGHCRRVLHLIWLKLILKR